MSKTYIDKLAFIYLKDKKILETRSRNKDTWYIPGGKHEVSETDVRALTREVKEELDVALRRKRWIITVHLRHKRTVIP